MSKLDELQREYDAMVKIAVDAIYNDIELEQDFEDELNAMAKVIKSLGGRL